MCIRDRENAKQDDIALKIATALYTIEKANPALKGALPDNYYSRIHIDTAKLASLLDEKMCIRDRCSNAHFASNSLIIPSGKHGL